MLEVEGPKSAHGNVCEITAITARDSELHMAATEQNKPGALRQKRREQLHAALAEKGATAIEAKLREMQISSTTELARYDSLEQLNEKAKQELGTELTDEERELLKRLGFT